MIQLHFAPRTRAVRVAWLLEELGLPYELVRGEFSPPTDRFFSQTTPTGKFPTLVDGDLVLCESGAIVETLLERYGEGRLAPPVGSDDRARYYQWLHFADSTAFPPIGIIVWLTRYRGEDEAHAALLADARARAASGLAFLEDALGEEGFVVGPELTAADVMLGFTLLAARAVGVLDDRFPKTNAYLTRLISRPAFQTVAALD
jgi:glutathione S-transferase